MQDHTEVVAAIRRQNWKLGGALSVDAPEAETMVFDLIQEAAKLVHARCVAAAEDAASRFGTSNIGVHETRGADRVVSALKTVNYTV